MKRSLFSSLLPIACCALFAIALLAARQAQAASRCWSVTDPANDVTIQGTTSTVSDAAIPASDIVAASVATSSGGWVFKITTKAPFAAPQGQVANLDLMIDADGNAANNYPRASNERAGADTFFVIISTTSSTNPWKLEHQEYDATSSEWITSPANLQFRFDGNVTTITIPADQLPATPAMRWRAVTNIGVIGKWYTRDSAPEHSADPSICGYMPYPATTSTAPLPPSYAPPTAPLAAAAGSASARWLAYVLATLGLAAMAYGVAKGKG